jgi:hypothetical protein
MGSPRSLRNQKPEISGTTDLLLPIAANIPVMILVLMAKGSHELAHCICVMLRSELYTEE